MKVLVTGSNGLLGQKLVYALAARDDVDLIATARGENRLRKQDGYTYQSMDIAVEQEVRDTILRHHPAVVINTAAMTNVDACETDKLGCLAANVNAVEYLVGACEEVGARFIHISTDFIFDGEDGPYAENAQPNPLSFYGKSKLNGERRVMESKLKWCIIRTVLVYGVVDNMSRSNVVLWAKGALEKGEPINVVNDQFRSPTLAEDLAQGCILAMDKGASGIYHISGKDQMSIDELVQRVAKHYGLSTKCMTPVSSDTLDQPAKRPPITGFILDKARSELGYQPHNFEEGLGILDEQLAAGAS